MKPLLLLDVDGVLNPMGRPAPDFRRYRCTIGDDVYTVHLNPRHGRRLLELALVTGSELVWATTWEHHANDWIAPRIGLPSLPVITLGSSSGAPASEHGEMFKTPHVAAYAGSGRSSGSTTRCGRRTRSTSGSIRVWRTSCSSTWIPGRD